MKHTLKISLIIITVLVLLLSLSLPIIGVLRIRKMLSEDRFTKDEVFSLVHEHENTILDDIHKMLVAEDGFPDHVPAEHLQNSRKIIEIKDISIASNYLKFYCGGAGMGGQTSYSGFYYFVSADAFNEYIGRCGYTHEGNGYIRRELDGDNESYLEPITDNFYYYEEKY